LAEARRHKGKGRGKAPNPRAVAARLLQQLAAGRSLSTLLDEGMSDVAPRDVALVKAICFGTARWWLQLQWLANTLLARPLKPRDSDILALILTGLYQLGYMRVAAHAAIDETVEAARALHKPWAAGLINALLRRFQREQEELQQRLLQDPEARHAHPQWLLDRLRRAWPEQWEAIVHAANQQAPMALRVNLGRISRRDYFSQLREAGIAARPARWTGSGVLLDKPLEVSRLPGFSDGLVSVQDCGAQLAAGLLDVQAGDRVLDACAAPGGKTGHLLEQAPADVMLTAVDIEPRRLRRIGENLDRLGLQAQVVQGDAAQPAGEWASSRYQRILLDVPCSATGVIRRHPDIKLLRKVDDIASLSTLQEKMLDSIWPLLARGGHLLYATCSLLPEENELQLRRFLARQTDARELKIEADWGHAREIGRQTLPGEDAMDGFYYACLEKC